MHYLFNITFVLSNSFIIVMISIKSIFTSKISQPLCNIDHFNKKKNKSYLELKTIIKIEFTSNLNTKLS